MHACHACISCMHTYYACIHIHARACIHAHTCVHMHAYTCMRMHAYTCTCAPGDTLGAWCRESQRWFLNRLILGAGRVSPRRHSSSSCIQRPVHLAPRSRSQSWFSPANLRPPMQHISPHVWWRNVLICCFSTNVCKNFGPRDRCLQIPLQFSFFLTRSRPNPTRFNEFYVNFKFLAWGRQLQ